MPYPAAAIANEFLKLAKDDGCEVTPMQMQKLVFFAHGWYLAFKNEPLIAERVEVWEYGPVVRSLYRDFKMYGSDSITKPAMEPAWDGLNLSLRPPTIDDGDDLSTNDYARALVRRVWDVYKPYSGIQLSRMTHEPDAPWSKAKEQGKVVIPDTMTRDYFISLANK